MNNVIYKNKEFIIFRCGNGVIVYNTNKPFETGHSHLRSFKSAKDSILFVQRNKIPKKVREYYLLTLYRISNNDSYCDRVLQLIETRQQKGKKQSYYNPSCRTG